MVYGIQKLENLNHASIDSADGDDLPFRDARDPVSVQAANMEVHFQNLEHVMVREINKFPVVVGCMAWLTNERILRALAACKTVSIVVNKEDFLRPDKGNWSQRKVKDLYSSLKGSNRFEMGLEYSCSGDPTLEPVRCAGVHGERRTVPPRMHHKFLVFCKQVFIRFVMDKVGDDEWIDTEREIDKIPDYPYSENNPGHQVRYGETIVPMAVWTGSFNASENGTRSLENALIIRDETIAAAYFREWKTIQGISEPLNWSSEWVDAEWRLGT